MTGEQLGQGRIVRDIERQTARLSPLSNADIAESYAPQLCALSHTRRPNHSPD